MSKVYEGILPEQWAEMTEEQRRPILDAFNEDWRDEKGVLMKGHPGLPGTGKLRRSYRKADYEDAIARAVTPEDFEKLLAKALNDALKAKSPRDAIKLITLVLDRLIGKPKQQLEVSTSSPEQWRVQMEERLSRMPVLLPGEEVIEASFRNVGTDGHHGHPGDSGQGTGQADTEPDADGDISVVDAM